jgi:hypothetical protein
MDADQTDELAEAQRRREAAERKAAQAAGDEKDSEQHARRAEKAGYLRSKLRERAESERDSS